jgi:hypothetical protein
VSPGKTQSRTVPSIVECWAQSPWPFHRPLACASDCTLDTSGCRPTLVLFGGRPNTTNSAVLGDTWEYANGAWQELYPADSPGERWGAGLASLDGNVVLFGGYGYNTTTSTSIGYRGDTWVWDGSDWTMKSPTHKPSSRYSPSMGTLKGKVVLFGGWGGSGLSDTWEWDGSDWTERTPAHVPGARDGAGMANIGGERLLMAGSGNDTWEWDGEDWILRTPEHSPVSSEWRAYVRAATWNGGVILFGGATGMSSSATYFSDTWRWDGQDWTEMLADGPPAARRSYAMAATGQGVLLFGGNSRGSMLDDTWEWSGTTWVERSGGPSPRLDVPMAAR